MEPFNFIQLRIPSGKVNNILFDVNEIIRNQLFMKALRNAAPQIFNAAISHNLNAAVEKTLYKYYSRWCTRPTPFGEFAGVLTANLSDTSELFTDNIIVQKEPDILTKKKITQYLNESELLHSYLHVNTSLYTIGSSFYYLQYSEERYRQIRVQRSEIIAEIIKAARGGIAYLHLLEILGQKKTDNAEARDIVKEMLEEQMLFSEYEFKLYETFEKYIVRQNRISASTLAYITNELTPTSGNLSYSFTTYPDGRISQKVITDIVSSIDRLGPLFQQRGNSRMKIFCNQFIKRYENQEVKLTHLFDPETGISYGDYKITATSELISRLRSIPLAEKETFTINEWQKTLVKKYVECIKSGNSQIELSLNDLDNDGAGRNNTFYIFGSILAKSIEHLDQGDFYFFLKNAGGSSAVNLMARFSLGNENLTEKLRSITAFEQSKTDALLAEVIHLPEGKTGNIVLRSQLRDFQITYLGNEECITLDDLWVSVINEKVVLRSEKYNKRIIPVLSNAHNYELGLPVYCFLGDLQPYSAQLHFEWSFLEDSDYLPRVVFEKIILSRATWNLSKNNYHELKKDLPQYIVVIEGDNELYLDLQQPLCHKILQDFLQKEEKIRVCEFLYTPDRCFLNGHASEIVIPIKGESNRSSFIPEIKKSGRKYAPGSEWLYLKLYTSTVSGDRILREKMPSFIQFLKEKDIIEKWFFIRYTDPEFHIRLRFYHGSHTDFYKDCLGLFNQYFSDEIEAGYIHEIQIAEYKPEYNRYANMERVELLFMKDSESALKAVEDEYSRIENSLLQIHSWLSDMSMPDKITFCGEQRDGLLKEHNKNQVRRLNREYRIQESRLIQVLNTKIKNSDLTGFNSKERASIIHMHINRHFKVEPLLYEMLLYHFLFKHYRSVYAKEKKMDIFV